MNTSGKWDARAKAASRAEPATADNSYVGVPLTALTLILGIAWLEFVRYERAS